jgi:glycosyltransferase involved in cell wall biosynthesis
LADTANSENDFPLVSIVMPAYNTERYAAEAIASIEKQTYPNLELILIEDCSQDRTREIITSALKEFSRPCRFIPRKHNAGLAANYNEGVSLANGEFITQVDSDDVLPPNSILDRVRFLQASPDVDFVHTDLLIINEHSQIIPIGLTQNG